MFSIHVRNCGAVRSERFEISLFGVIPLQKFVYAAVLVIFGLGCYANGVKDQSLDGVSCNSVRREFWVTKNCDLSGGDQVWYSEWIAPGQGTASIRFMKVTGISVDEASNARSNLEQRHSLGASEDELSGYIRDVCTKFNCSIPTWFNLAYSRDQFDWYHESRGQTSALVFAFDRANDTCFCWTFFER